MRIVDSRANERVAETVLDADGSIFEAFYALGLGWSVGRIVEYLEATQTWGALSEELRGQVLGMMMAFACVAVERDRELREAGL